MYFQAESEDKEELQYLIDLYLWDGFGPNGTSLGKNRRKKPVSISSQLWDNSDSYWNDPIDDW